MTAHNYAIAESNTRRFRHIESESVLAIYDQNRSWTKYAQVGTFDGVVCFVSEPRTYFADEVEEIR